MILLSIYSQDLKKNENEKKECYEKGKDGKCIEHTFTEKENITNSKNKKDSRNKKNPKDKLLKETRADYDFKESVTRKAGDSRLTLNLGFYFPLFFQDTYKSSTMHKTNLFPLGLSFGIGWGIFLSPGFNLGFELFPSLTWGVNTDVFFNLELGTRLSYYFRIKGKVPIEIPLFLSFGFLYTQYKNFYYPGFYFKPGISILAAVFNDWSLGASLTYMFAPQIYSGKDSKYLKIPKEQSRMGNFLELHFTVEYNF